MAKNVVLRTARGYVTDGLKVSFARLGGERVYRGVTQSSYNRFTRAMGGRKWRSKIADGGWIVYDLICRLCPFREKKDNG